MTDVEAPDEHEAIEGDLSDFHERSLPPERAREVEAHLASCEQCRAAFEELRETMGALSGLHRMAAPQHFEKGVEETIRRRSAGRFFGRKAFGDRVPFELLAIIALVLGVVLYLLIRYSDTGSLRYHGGADEPAIHPDAEKEMPRPWPDRPSE